MTANTQSIILYGGLLNLKRLRNFEIMSRTMQNVILFVDANLRNCWTSQKSGNSFMNRFSIDEDAAFEIIGIHHMDAEQSFKFVKGPDGLIQTKKYQKIGKWMKNVFQNISFSFQPYFIFEIRKGQCKNFEWNQRSCRKSCQKKQISFHICWK